MAFRDLVRQGMKSVTRSQGGSGYLSGIYGGGRLESGRNWNKEAGLRFDNSVVYAAIMYAWNALSEVDIYVGRPKGDGTFEEIPNHPITKLLTSPNPWYDGTTLLGGQIVSELAGPGYSCTYKHRSSAGKLVGLEYVPHFCIVPESLPNSRTFIDYFRLAVVGGFDPVLPENILMQRYGFINPLRPQTCFGPLLAALLEVVTDKQAAHYTAALLTNIGVTPHLISPAIKDMNGQEIIFGKEQSDQILSLWEERISGDSRGKPLVAPIPLNVDNLAMDPATMNLEAIRNIAEERICAALQIPPQALNLGTALENANNRASAEAALKQAARSFVKPYMRRKGQQFTWDLVPELGTEGEQVLFRVSAIEALQEDKTEAAKRDEIEVRSHMTQNEKRAQKGLPPHPDGDSLPRIGGAATADPNDDEDEESTSTGPAKKRGR